jgi:hypothetical protein
MTTPRDLPLDAVTTAWRPREPGGAARAHPAFYDLDEASRLQAYELTRALRAAEAALDPQGLSTTGHAVLRRIRGR